MKTKPEGVSSIFYNLNTGPGDRTQEMIFKRKIGKIHVKRKKNILSRVF